MIPEDMVCIGWQVRIKLPTVNDGNWSIWYTVQVGELGQLQVAAKTNPDNYELRPVFTPKRYT